MSDQPPSSRKETPTGRRDFFSEAFKEALRPISGLLAKRIEPVLRALDQLPTDGPAAASPLTRDQPHLEPDPCARDNSTQPYSVRSLLPERYLRPPGATPEGMPEGLDAMCSHCGACTEACPAHAIQIDKTGLVAEGLPYIIPTDMPCVVCDSLACMHACPSGALKLVEKTQIRMGLAKVNHLTCLRSKNEECRLCVDCCPFGESAITISASGRIRVKLNGCVGCGLCEHACPTDPRSIIIEPAKPKTEPILA